MDIVVHCSRQMPCHVAKIGILKIPFVCSMSQACHSLFIHRSETKDAADVLAQIEQRQLENEKGLWPHSTLIIYPEGATTNGKYLIRFKKGAFAALRSVQPVLIKYESPFADFEGCIIPFGSNLALALTNIMCRIKIKELPVFLPNDDFFEHHQRKDE